MQARTRPRNAGPSLVVDCNTLVSGERKWTSDKDASCGGRAAALRGDPSARVFAGMVDIVAGYICSYIVTCRVDHKQRSFFSFLLSLFKLIM